ncbi:MAG: hypothetical protein GSR85_02150 [Desulfurococcales archaeon]|nr:hypothetical protein [Desulfurococcales archaeon]
MSWDDGTVSETPVWSGASLAVAARGYESLTGRELVLERAWKPRIEDLPFLGVEWECEYYLDTGSKSARSLSGVEEGFVIKTSVYARCIRDGRLRERILYPAMKPKAAYSFLALRGGERLRQAASYIAEIAAITALATGEAKLPGDVDGYPRLIIRHGSILQRIEGYMNEVYEIPRNAAESILYYSGLESSTVNELLRYSTIERQGKGMVVSPGLLAPLLIEKLRESIGRDVSVAGVAEEVSRGRHLIVESLIQATYAVDVVGDPSLEGMIHRGFDELGYGMDDPLSCLDDVDPDSIGGEDLYTRASRYASYMRQVIYRGILGLDNSRLRNPHHIKEAVMNVKRLKRGDVVRRVYQGQVLNRFISLASDSQFLMLYIYLYGPEAGYLATPRHSKSSLVAPLAVDNLRQKGLDQLGGISSSELEGMIDGVEYRYIFPEPIPPCSTLEAQSSKLGVERRLIAELVRVKPPVRLEYFSSDPRRGQVDSRIYAGSHITQYGVPSQLLVVDSRSRINEWDYRALRSLLELQGRRVLPYSTFIRDFQSRMRHIV